MSILGDNSQGAATSPGNTDRALVTRFTAPDTGSNGTAYAYFGSSSTAGASAKWLAYTNNAGEPGTLIFASAGQVVPAGGGLINFGSVTASWVASTEYFIGIVYDSFEAEVSVDDSLSGMDTEMANGTLSYATPPTNWPTPSDPVYTNIRVNAWVDYPLAGGGSLLLPARFPRALLVR